METTNEIENQLKRKADKYLEQKAREMFTIHKEIAEYLGTDLPSRIHYITNYSQYGSDLMANRDSYFTSSSASAIKLKYQRDLEKNYKEKLVAKYTKELLEKVAIF